MCYKVVFIFLDHYKPFVLSLTRRTLNPVDYSGAVEAGETGTETTEGAGECSLSILIIPKAILSVLWIPAEPVFMCCID